IAERLIPPGVLLEVGDPGHLEPHEVVGVVGDPLRVGLGEPHPHVRREAEGRHARHSTAVLGRCAPDCLLVEKPAAAGADPALEVVGNPVALPDRMNRDGGVLVPALQGKSHSCASFNVVRRSVVTDSCRQQFTTPPHPLYGSSPAFWASASVSASDAAAVSGGPTSRGRSGSAARRGRSTGSALRGWPTPPSCALARRWPGRPKGARLPASAG